MNWIVFSLKVTLPIGLVLLGIITCMAQLDQNLLQVEGSLKLDKTGPLLSRLILNTEVKNDPGRYAIQFSNNIIAPFLGDDFDHQFFNFYSKWDNNRTFDATINIHGSAVNTWGNRLSLTHDGTDGIISTDVGDLIISPSDGNGNVGIGTTDPTSPLTVAGSIELKSGSVKYPDQTRQYTAGQVTLYYSTVNKLIGNGQFDTVTAGCPTNYRVTGGGWTQNVTAQRPFSTSLSASRNGPSGSSSWTVGILNTASYIVNIEVTAICAPYQ